MKSFSLIVTAALSFVFCMSGLFLWVPRVFPNPNQSVSFLQFLPFLIITMTLAIGSARTITHLLFDVIPARIKQGLAKQAQKAR